MYPGLQLKCSSSSVIAAKDAHLVLHCVQVPARVRDRPDSIQAACGECGLLVRDRRPAGEVDLPGSW